MILHSVAAANHNTYITVLSSDSPIIGIEALLGLAALKVKFQNSSVFIDKNKNQENQKDQDGEICLTEVPPRADNQRPVGDLAANTIRESQASLVVDQPTARAVLGTNICTRKNSTSGGS